MTKNKIVHVNLHVNEGIQFHMDLSKCITYQEKIDLDYIMVNVN